MMNGYLLLILVMLVIIINGATDAPNAVATIVATSKIKIKYALFIASICNFLGVLVMSLTSPKIINVIYKIVDFRDNNDFAIYAVASSMVAIIIWGVITWYFGIPTSESHALVASLTGAAIGIKNTTINIDMWNRVFQGIIYAFIIGILSGYLVFKIINIIPSNYFKKIKIFQYLSGMLLAFIHGAQDGLKFLGVLLLVGQICFNKIEKVPFWMIVVCSVLMFVGTMIGGKKIIEKVGNELTTLNEKEGVSSDISSIVSLFIGTILGIPLSTTQMKTATIIGVTFKQRKMNKKVLTQLIIFWSLTFPICFLIGYIITKLFLKL